MSFQVRSEATGIFWFPTLKEANQAAREDSTIWKISFDVGNERVRLVRNDKGDFILQQLEGFLDKVLEKQSE